MDELKPNKGKKLEIEVGGSVYSRFPVRTDIVKAGDSIENIIRQCAGPSLLKGDVIFISERIVAIAQGRAFPIKDIKPSKLAKFLVRFVYKSPYGIGLGSPWTMELAIREAGVFRILFAAAAAAITKPFGLKGVFYMVCGNNVAAIDGPCSYTLPPYNEYAKLGPKDPDKAARVLKEKLGHEIVIIDANDLGVNVLGRSTKSVSDDFAKKVFRDNPLGQSSEQTPVCIVRKKEVSEAK